MTIYSNIIEILSNLNIHYNLINHPVSKCCNDSKLFRSEQGLEGIGSKNIIFHCKGNYYLVTTHGDKLIKARNFKKEFGSKDIRFAYEDEISSLFQSKIGSIPPFGFINSNFSIYVDLEIFEHEYFIFNPSDPTISIRITTNDLKQIYSSIENSVKFFFHKEDEFKII